MSNVILSDTVQAPPEPIYVGLDLSLTNTGVAVITPAHYTTHRIPSDAPKNPTTGQQAQRLARLTKAIYDTFDLYPASTLKIAVEGPSYASTGSSAHIMGGLWWLVRTDLEHEGYDVVVIPPASVKKYATGAGNASKDQVLAAMRARHDGHPIDGDLPAKQLDAMKGVGL